MRERMNSRFPYICTLYDENETEFIPTMIDYDNQQVWRQLGQASNNGEWYSFDDVIFKENDNFIDPARKEMGQYCQKGVNGCLCKIGFPPEYQCEYCNEDRVRDSHCECNYKFHEDGYTPDHNYRLTQEQAEYVECLINEQTQSYRRIAEYFSEKYPKDETGTTQLDGQELVRLAMLQLDKPLLNFSWKGQSVEEEEIEVRDSEGTLVEVGTMMYSTKSPGVIPIQCVEIEKYKVIFQRISGGGIVQIPIKDLPYSKWIVNFYKEEDESNDNSEG